VASELETYYKAHKLGESSP